MSPLRLFLLILALGMIPFATTYNGATLLGMGATVTFMALSVTEHKRRERQ